SPTCSRPLKPFSRPGTRTRNLLSGLQPSSPSRKSSPAAVELWSRTCPAAPVPSPEKEKQRLSSYFKDTTLGIDRVRCRTRSGLFLSRTESPHASLYPPLLPHSFCGRSCLTTTLDRSC